MKANFKNKTIASLLSLFVGALGLHRFYLYGRKDVLAWVYVVTSVIYLMIFAVSLLNESLAMSVARLFPMPVFVAAIETLAIGLTDDRKWDKRHNTRSLIQSRSRWPLVVLLVLTLFITYTGFIASLARAIDLLYTGGSFG
ncbi:TM2 domain-containing protein [Lacisediminimonas sp.]|uniref:TM2 domain-containing protein n=1 Tax=Lacisediminimonas sp. TaxID=3060582 RepID=UPI00271B620E|nr:TM2 domain-containing protein [Lacisediminimonas sp.]MDO8300739.1 TM2 domain-containing protein [Lacisediminimonas sp.]